MVLYLMVFPPTVLSQQKDRFQPQNIARAGHPFDVWSGIVLHRPARNPHPTVFILSGARRFWIYGWILLLFNLADSPAWGWHAQGDELGGTGLRHISHF